MADLQTAGASRAGQIVAVVIALVLVGVVWKIIDYRTQPPPPPPPRPDVTATPSRVQR